MLELHSPSSNSSGTDRRAFLRVGTASLFGLTLPHYLAARAASDRRNKDVNCILVWTEGGLSNIDTFDMKPNAPIEFRGEFRPVSTSVPGTHICEHLPRMARHMHRVCVVKSIAHTESGDHVAATHYMLTGYPQRPDISGQPIGSTIYPSFGSLVSRQKGWQNAMPPNVRLGGKISPYTGAGYLGSQFNPLGIAGDPNASEFQVEDVTIPTDVGADRTERRRRMLQRLDAWQKSAEQTSGPVFDRNQFYRQAFDLVTSPAAKRAFNLSEEPPAVRDRYGLTREGQGMLLARRLIEAGVRFVTVGTGGWDTHANNFVSLKNKLLPTLDQGWSALLDDLDQRGLLANTVVMCVGEFGRTPGVNGAAGRDHYAPCNTVMFSGAGVQGGNTVGKTDGKCTAVVGRAETAMDYAATVFELLGIDGAKEYHTEDGRPVLVNNGGRPIAGVIA